MKREEGFTLAEVLAAIVLMGMAVTLAANALSWQVKISKRGEERIEVQQALRVATVYIEREIRTARAVSLQTPGALKIVRNNGQILYFYVDDKDKNGIKDVYQELTGVPTPIVSNIVEMGFSEKSPGCWEVSLSAQCGGEESKCTFVVRKRAS